MMSGEFPDVTDHSAGEDAMSNEIEWVLVKRDDLLRWAEDFARDNDPGDDTDIVTPFDDYLLQPPAEAQPVAWEWEYIGVDQYPRGHKVARSLREMDPTNPPYPETWRPTRPLVYGDTAPPSAPVGVEGLVVKWKKESESLDIHPAGLAARRVCAIELEHALAQQPAAAGEEIMVNAAHDVYTLPLQPSGLSSGPRFVVHVPAPEQPAAPTLAKYQPCGCVICTFEAEHGGNRADHPPYVVQQPAAVDEAMVERAWEAAMEIKHNKESWFPMTKRRMKRALTAALAAQPGGSDNDR